MSACWHASPALYAVVIAYGLAMIAGLYAAGGSTRCTKCGRRCGGRIAGGTVDKPVCVRCID